MNNGLLRALRSLQLLLVLVSAVGSVAQAAAWTPTGSMNVARCNHTATKLTNGKVLVAGGATLDTIGNATPAAISELYDPSTGVWSLTGPLNIPRSFGHTAALLPNGKVLVAGGFGGGTIASAELYDPGTGTWTITGTMSEARVLYPNAILTNGNVLAIGGYDGDRNWFLNSVELYDSSTGTWSINGDLGTGLSESTATVLANNMILVAGSNYSELYNPNTGTGVYSGPMNEVHNRGNAILLANGKVLISGGYGSSGGIATAGAELYDPGTGGWSVAESMNFARYSHTMTRLDNGKILVTGGNQPSELYNPITGIWNTAGSNNENLPVGEGNTATLLDNGKVLITGGMNGWPNITAKSILYNPLADGLVAHYPFNGNANDESGNGNNGTVNGATLTADRFGNANSAYSFNGATSYISSQNAFFDIGMPAYTISTWFKIDNLSNAGIILNSNPHSGIGITFNHPSGGEGRLTYWLDDNSEGWDISNGYSGGGIGSKSNYVQNVWYHVVVVKNSNSYSFYVNSALDGSVTTDLNVVSRSIGMFFGSASFLGAYLAGAIDDIRIYNRALTAAEVQQLYTGQVPGLALTITKTGTGSGTVTSNQPGINCGADCTESYTYGTLVTLTATPATGSNFGGWSGDADCSDGTVTMDAAKNCIATFTLKTYTLAVARAGNGFGNVTISPTVSNCAVCLAIGCPIYCGVYNVGSVVFLTATPATGSYLANWSGDCTGNGTCSVVMNADKSVTANFNLIATAPTCTSNAATNVTVNSATLNGNVVSSSATATANFELGPTSTYGTNLAAVPSQIYSSTPVAISATSTGLACKTTYHYRCKATNSAGTGYGADKSFTTLATCPANAWLYPANPAVVVGKPLALDIHVNSNSNAVGAYDFTVNFDTTKLLVDTAYPNTACIQGVCPGSAALASNNVLTDNATGKIRLSGFDTTGIGSGNDLQLLVMHFMAKNITGLTPVGLVTNELTNPQGMPLGGVATGTTVKVSPGLCGDSDGNYNVNIVDALSISRYVVGYPPPPTINTNLADVNRSGTVTIVDALHIARFSVGLVVTGTCAIGQPL